MLPNDMKFDRETKKEIYDLKDKENKITITKIEERNLLFEDIDVIS